MPSMWKGFFTIRSSGITYEKAYLVKIIPTCSVMSIHEAQYSILLRKSALSSVLQFQRGRFLFPKVVQCARCTVQLQRIVLLFYAKRPHIYCPEIIITRILYQSHMLEPRSDQVVPVLYKQFLSILLSWVAFHCFKYVARLRTHV